MLGFKPSDRIWAKLNAAFVDESAAEVLVTMISWVSMSLVYSGVSPDEESARVHLAAVLLSPDTDAKPGSLAGRLPAEFARLDDGKWLQ